MMLKTPLIAVFWFFALGLPATILAIAGAAYIDMHLTQIFAYLASLELATTIGRIGWAAEASQRLPELAGMVIGMVVISTIYLFVRKPVEMEYSSAD